MTGVLVGLTILAPTEMWLPVAAEARPVRPRFIVWAWDRPEDLGFLRPSEAGVAYYAGTVSLGAAVTSRPRANPIAMPLGLWRIPVVRLERPWASTAPLDAAMRREAVEAILALAADGAAAGLQIDFDARFSERAFYAALLRDLRGRLPRGAELSITALVSWCMGDRWLDGIAADVAVPMLYRMGRDGPEARRIIGAGKEFVEPRCRPNLGLSNDEAWPERLPASRRYWLFHDKAWTQTSYEKARKALASYASARPDSSSEKRFTAGGGPRNPEARSTPAIDSEGGRRYQ